VGAQMGGVGRCDEKVGENGPLSWSLLSVYSRRCTE
jgi:hypothetical protein